MSDEAKADVENEMEQCGLCVLERWLAAVSSGLGTDEEPEEE